LIITEVSQNRNIIKNKKDLKRNLNKVILTQLIKNIWKFIPKIKQLSYDDKFQHIDLNYDFEFKIFSEILLFLVLDNGLIIINFELFIIYSIL
jgi:hypothetical protein